MKKTNKNSTDRLIKIIITLIIVILIILIVIAWKVLSKSNFTTSSSNSFGTFKARDAKANSIPSKLRWNDPFAKRKDSKDDKPKGSYLHYLSEQNKNK